MVASVHTAINMISELKEQDFDVVVVDEAHHAVMPTYQELLTALDFLSAPAQRRSTQLSTISDQSMSEPELDDANSSSSTMTPSSSSSGDEIAEIEDGESTAVSRGPRNPNKMLVGFTATPYRRRPKDSELLLEMLEPVFSRTISSMVKEGYLCPVSAHLLSMHNLYILFTTPLREAAAK